MDGLNFIRNAFFSLDYKSVIEILIVAYLLYRGYLLIKETRAEQLLRGIVFILLMIPITNLIGFTMLYSILSKAVTVGVLSLVIIFQPEIRRVLEHLGRSAFSERKKLGDKTIVRMVDEIVNAVDNLSSDKTGALIAIERNTMLRDIVSSGSYIDGAISQGIIENIFVPNTALHDGAMIIRDGRILAAGCVLPLTSTNEISKKLGTRHRAGIGLSEVSDAIVIIVSEETGTISLALNGKLVRNYDKDRLKAILIKLLEKYNPEEEETVREKVRKWVNSLKETF